MTTIKITFSLNNLNYKIVLISILLGAIVPGINFIYPIENIWGIIGLWAILSLTHGVCLTFYLVEKISEFIHIRLYLNILFFTIVYWLLYLISKI